MVNLDIEIIKRNGYLVLATSNDTVTSVDVLRTLALTSVVFVNDERVWTTLYNDHYDLFLLLDNQLCSMVEVSPWWSPVRLLLCGYDDLKWSYRNVALGQWLMHTGMPKALTRFFAIRNYLETVQRYHNGRIG